MWVNARVLLVAWRAKPTAVTIPIAMVPIGVIALVLGEDASRAFTNIGGEIVIRSLGAAMALGGVSVAFGILRNDVVYEGVGLTLCSLGALLYGTGVILGLGEQGLIAGLGYLAFATGFLGRVWLLQKAAGRRLRRNRE